MRTLFKNNGFTLIELMVSMLILATVFISMINLSAMATKDTVSSKKMLEASLIADSYMQEILSKSFSTSSCSGGNGDRTVSNYSSCAYDSLSAGVVIKDVNGNLMSSVGANEYKDAVSGTLADLNLYKVAITVPSSGTNDWDVGGSGNVASGGYVTSSNVLKITITVTDAASGATYVTLTGYKANI